MPSRADRRREGLDLARVDLPSIDWDEVAELVTDSYRLVAPKTLVARLGE